MKPQADFFGLLRPKQGVTNIGSTIIWCDFSNMDTGHWRWSNKIVENIQLTYYDKISDYEILNNTDNQPSFDIGWPEQHPSGVNIIRYYNLPRDIIIDTSYSRNPSYNRYFTITGNDICNNFPKNSLYFQNLIYLLVLIIKNYGGILHGQIQI